MVGIEMFGTHASCSAGPSCPRWRSRWLEECKGEGIEIDPSFASYRSPQSLVQTPVCEEFTIQRLSVRTVCRVREISGRYKFGEEFALSLDGERHPRAGPG
jgi:hypothetical protein